METLTIEICALVFYRKNIVLKPVEKRENIIIVCRSYFYVCVTKHVILWIFRIELFSINYNVNGGVMVKIEHVAEDSF